MIIMIGKNQPSMTGDHLIDSLDLEPIYERFLDPKLNILGNKKYSSHDIYKLGSQYRRFLFIKKKYPNAIIIPFRELDEFWHQHILFTQKYTEDCLKIFGFYMHHTPHKQVTDSDKKFYREHYLNTLKLIRQEFPNAD